MKRTRRNHGATVKAQVALAAFQYAHDRLLSGRGAGRRGPLWPAGDLQYGSRVPVHQSGFYGAPEQPRHPDQHGRERMLAGQRVRRATLEEHSIRRGLFARVRHRQCGRPGLGALSDVHNQTRPHQALDGHTPDQVYYANLTTRRTATWSATRQAPLKEWPRLSNQPEPPLSGNRRLVRSAYTTFDYFSPGHSSNYRDGCACRRVPLGTTQLKHELCVELKYRWDSGCRCNRRFM